MPRERSNTSRVLLRALLGAGLPCLVILAATALYTRAQALTHVVTYRLVPEQGAATEGQMAHATRVVGARLKSLAKAYALADYAVEALGGERLRVRFRTHRDTDEALAWVTMTGHAQFCVLHPNARLLDSLAPGETPEGYHVKVYRKQRYRLSRGGDLVTYEYPYLVRKEPLMRVRRFARAHFATVGLAKETVLTFEFEGEQAEDFKNLTALNVGRDMVMLIDGELFFPPRKIASAVVGGRVQIRGYFYNPPLRKLVRILAAGTLPGRLEELSHEAQ